jgi:hypothetical protein
MPLYRNYWVLEIAQGVKAFFRIEAGVTRGQASEIPQPSRTLSRKKPEQARRRLRKEHQRGFQPHPPGAVKEEGVNPENIIWIFGTARVGSTWLSSMMKGLKGHSRWNEPLVGTLFGNYRLWNAHNQREAFIFSPSYKETWLRSIRSFVLDGANARYSEKMSEGYLVIKEPNGSRGAPWLMEALPESRMISLIRDPRDVVASILDGSRRGGWAHAEESKADTDPDAFVEKEANTYVRNVGSAMRAYDAHEGRKALVRYEDLREDTLGTMKRIYSALEIAAGDKDLARVVNKHSWENIPEEKKGKGKLRRKATPGGWKGDLTPQQVQIVEKATAPWIEKFYAK